MPNQKFLTNTEANRLGAVVNAAVRAHDVGVLAWACRAMNDGQMLGHLRDRDKETLNRLEVTYGSEFYAT